MNDVFSVIYEIKSIQEDITRLSLRKSELTCPILSDLDLIPALYNWFMEAAKKLPKRNKSILNKEFIFIVIFLYSPGTLAGGKMKLGVRKRIADTLNINACTAVSNKCTEIVFMYKIYKYFRDDLHILYSEIMSKIQENVTK